MMNEASYKGFGDIAIVGDEKAVATQIQRIVDSGATDVWPASSPSSTTRQRHSAGPPTCWPRSCSPSADGIQPSSTEMTGPGINDDSSLEQKRRGATSLAADEQPHRSLVRPTQPSDECRPPSSDPRRLDPNAARGYTDVALEGESTA
jgi:hypothetical protein